MALSISEASPKKFGMEFEHVEHAEEIPILNMSQLQAEKAVTLLETKSSQLKINGWKMNVLLG